MSVFLIGFMGSGKSTIGEQLSIELSMSIVDTDDFIEKRYEKKISEIFKESGEEVFRTYESAVLKKITNYEIVSTGGGIVEKKENINEMKKNGLLIYLKTPFKEIVRRLENDVSRPLWNRTHEEKMESLYKRRDQLYKKYADIIINTNNKTKEEIIFEIKTLINKEDNL